MNEDNKKYEEIIKKMEALKASGGLDLSTEEDLAMAIMIYMMRTHKLFPITQSL